MSNKKRVVLDTNIIISALKNNTAGGLCFTILERFKQNHFLLILNAHLFQEYDKKLNELFKNGELSDANKISQTINEIHRRALFCRMPVASRLPDIPNDPDDILLIEIPIVENIDYVVTDDNKTRNNLKNIFSSGKPEVINSREFIKILRHKDK